MKPWRGACLLLSVAALAATAILWISDGLHGLRFTLLHQRAGALALILVGTAFILLQTGSRGSRADAAKGFFLGAAFVLWGSEQFLPAGPVLTVIDGSVITIFVVDLGLIIFGRLRDQK